MPIRRAVSFGGVAGSGSSFRMSFSLVPDVSAMAARFYLPAADERFCVTHEPALSLPQMQRNGTLDNHKGLFMLVVMKANASEEQVQAVCQKIESCGLRAHAIPGAQRTAIGITGNRGEVETGTFESLEGVQEVIKVSKPYKLVSRDVKAEDTIIRFPGSDASIGDNEIAVIAGPCGVESHEQAFAVAERVAKAGARFFRGGAYKPRTSPYAFQGLGELGLQILAEVRERFGLLIVTEAVDHESLALVDD